MPHSIHIKIKLPNLGDGEIVLIFKRMEQHDKNITKIQGQTPLQGDCRLLIRIYTSFNIDSGISRGHLIID